MEALNVNNLDIVFRGPNGLIYAGHGNWVSEDIHNLLSKSKSPAAFVQTLSIAIWEGVVIDDQLQLNFEQYKSCFEYWLKNVYEPKLSKSKLSGYDSAAEMYNFDKYIGIAIASDLELNG